MDMGLEEEGTRMLEKVLDNLGEAKVVGDGEGERVVVFIFLFQNRDRHTLLLCLCVLLLIPHFPHRCNIKKKCFYLIKLKEKLFFV